MKTRNGSLGWGRWLSIPNCRCWLTGKQSGMGVELGHYVIDEYLRVNHMLIEFKAS